MGFLSHRVERSEIVAGDHIYTYRAVFAYSHHGIYVGGNKVVHFTNERHLDSSGNAVFSFSASGSSLNHGSSSSKLHTPCPTYPDCGYRQPESGVVLSCLDCFLGDGSLYRFEYGVTPSIFVAKVRAGTCTTAQSDPAELVVHRAMYLLQNGFGNYDVFKNNCEDFAMYCKTGLLILDNKGVGRSGQAASVIGAPLAALVSTPLRLLSGPVGAIAATAGMYCVSRYATDIGVRTDVAKVPVEVVASLHGWEGTMGESAEAVDTCETQCKESSKRVASS